MKRFICIFLFMVYLTVFSAQSVIVEVEGKASLGDDKTRKQTIEEAKTNAKKLATETAGTYIKSETVVNNYVTEKDVLEAYSQAVVKILEELASEWFQDPNTGESYKIRLKVEVLPKTENLEKMYSSTSIFDDPQAPLMIKSWCDSKNNSYKQGEKVKIYVRGNKPFYARVVYIQADGTQVQLLPNPYRKDNYFNGGTVYELPSGLDKYELEVSPPFGTEKIVVYAGTQPLGEIKLENAEALFMIQEKSEDTGVKTRGIKLQKKEGSSGGPAEFFECEVVLKTEK